MIYFLEIVIEVGTCVLATIIPFVPAGGGKMFRAGKKAEKVIENIGKASKQDKVAGVKVLEDVAKKNGFEKFHILKDDFSLPDPKKWDAFFTKEGELYFGRKPGKNEFFEPIFTNYFK